MIDCGIRVGILKLIVCQMKYRALGRILVLTSNHWDWKYYKIHSGVCILEIWTLLNRYVSCARFTIDSEWWIWKDRALRVKPKPYLIISVLCEVQKIITWKRAKGVSRQIFQFSSYSIYCYLTVLISCMDFSNFGLVWSLDANVLISLL